MSERGDQRDERREEEEQDVLPPRLIDGVHTPGSREDVAAAHLRSATAVPEIGPVALARVWRRLETRAGGRSRARGYSLMRWRTATVVGAFALGIGSVTVAAVWVVAPRVRAKAAATTPRELSAPMVPSSRHTGELSRVTPPVADETPPAPEVAAAEPPPAAPPAEIVREPRMVTATAPAPSAAPSKEAVAPHTNPRLLAMAEPQARPAEPLAAPAPEEAAPPPVAVAPQPPTLPEPRTTLEPPAFVPVAPVVPAAPSAAATPRAPAAGSPQPSRSRVSPPTMTPATRLAMETELLGLALGRLRRDHDPLSALELLDQHATRFPRGTLMPEAELTRVDALLALDRREEASRVLNRLALPPSARGRELLVVRGELAAGARRYSAAIGDFSRALSDPALEPELFERALHGRGACHLATRNPTAARADLDAYVRRFPSGRFATTTRITLQDLAANGH